MIDNNTCKGNMDEENKYKIGDTIPRKTVKKND